MNGTMIVLAHCFKRFCTFLHMNIRMQVKKNTLAADFNETFEFAVDAGGVAGELLLQAYDWDRAGSHDLIGEAILSRGRLQNVVRAKETWEGQDNYILQKDGKRVVGSDKQQTTVTLKLAVSRPIVYFDNMDIDEKAEGPRQLTITVVRCKNLPKCDVMGTCDAFVEVIFEGVSNKTKVVKNSYAPDFYETFSVNVPEASSPTSQDVIMRVYDWNLTSSSELVGECSVPAARISDVFKAKIGWEGEESFMLSKEGKPVIGHNQSRTEVTVRLRVLKAAKAFENLVMEPESSGSRRLVMTVISAKHLPKMDTMGTIDPYCTLVLQEIELRTKTLKDTYTPEWNETFTWEVHGVEKGHSTDFRLTLNDWDATSKDEEVGSFTIPASRMAEIVRAKIGWEGQETFTLYHEGKGVVGQDKELSEVTVKVSITEVPKAFQPLDIDEQANGVRQVRITLMSAGHLPKMDVMGSVDAYVVMFLGGREMRTKTIKNNYSPVWDETFLWNVSDVEKGCDEELRAVVMDWDATSKDDEVGSLTIPASRMSEIVRAKIGWEGQETFTLYREGKAVIGQDKELSKVAVKVSVVEVPKAFLALDLDQDAKGQRRIEVTLASAQHLPKVSTHTFSSFLFS